MIQTFLTLTSSFICETLGCFDVLLKTLLIFVVMDYITGIMKAIVNKKLSSNVGFKGICKKILIIFMVAIGFSLDELLSTDTIRYIVITFYIINEGISIIENASYLGLPIPDKIKETLQNLK